MGYLMTVIFIKTVIIIPIVLDLKIEAQTVSKFTHKGFFFHPNLVNLLRGMITKKM